MIIFASADKMGYIDDQRTVNWIASQFLVKYKKNLQEIRTRKEWKTQGSGANFMGIYDPQLQETENHEAMINGLSFTTEGDMIYSVSIDNCSGIFSKHPGGDVETEGHIIHKTNLGFYGIDYNPSNAKIVASVGNGFYKHLALFNNGSAAYQLLTEGECVDDNPVWSRTNSNEIYYDSCGVGLNSQGIPVGYSPRTICKLNLDSGQLDELISIDKYDCMNPRDDQHGNVYFIKKPMAKAQKKSASLLDILFIPFKILKAIFLWVNFFTMRYSGDTLTSSGPNSAKAKGKNPEEIFIQGNLVNAAKTLKENASAGEKHPGIAPRGWELSKLDSSGSMVCIKKGVLDFNLTRDGRIVYSNGKHIVELNDGCEEVLGTVPLATCIKIW